MPRSRKTQPGKNMKFQEYAAAPGCNFSTLKHMDKSPLHYKYALENPPKETTAMLLGRATHTAVFEPERFQLEYAVWEGSRRTNAYKDFAEECQDQGRSVLREDEYETALAIRDSVRSVPAVAERLEKGRPEVSLFWRNPPTGVECKGRLDWIAKNAILDLKTTVNVDEGWFAQQAWRMGYFHQAAMYQEGFSVSSGKGVMLPFGIIAVERKPPYACRLFWLDEESMEKAWGEYVTWLENILEHRKTNIWPGPEPAEEKLLAPAWAITRSEEETIVDFDGLEDINDRKAG